MQNSLANDMSICPSDFPWNYSSFSHTATMHTATGGALVLVLFLHELKVCVLDDPESREAC